MAKELRLSLHISKENVGLLRIVALHGGWSPGQVNDDDTPYTAEQFLSEKILKEFVAAKVSAAFDWYFGVSAEENRNKIVQALQAAISITFEDAKDEIKEETP
jgi:hypothetical protein